jgi:CRISPR-associated protein Cas1
MLNYCYMVLRAAVARSLVSSGLLPTLGIHHHNRYNAFCLADDIMEPYRVFADAIVHGVLADGGTHDGGLDRDVKTRLLGVLTADVQFKDGGSPLMVGLHRTTASLARCFQGEQKSIDYPGP